MFVLAHSCLRQAQSISLRSIKSPPTPPPVPPKPNRLSTTNIKKPSPPPLPKRPSQKKLDSYSTLPTVKMKSKAELISKEPHLYKMNDVYSDSENDDEEDDPYEDNMNDMDDEDDEDEDELCIFPMTNKGKSMR